MPRQSEEPNLFDSEMCLESTNDYEIVVEYYMSPRSVTGTESGYAVRHKKTKVIEARAGSYMEALQTLPQIQENFDRFMGKFVSAQRGLN